MVVTCHSSIRRQRCVQAIFGTLYNISLFKFLSRISTHNMQSAILFCHLSPSVHPLPVLCLNECTYRRTFWQCGIGIILVLLASPPLKIRGGTPSVGCLIHADGKIVALITLISDTVRRLLLLLSLLPMYWLKWRCHTNDAGALYREQWGR